MPVIDTITLVVVCDDHYVIMLAALIKSIEANLRKEVSIDLWIVEDGVSADNIKKVQDAIDAQITSLHWVKISDVVKQSRLPKDRSSYPLNIYARLFIPDFIPAHAEKVLYLDVDMIVMADLYTMWNTDITHHYVAAVQDPRVLTFDNDWGGIINYKQLGLQSTSKYFNTGLLLINTKKWRDEGITGKVFDTITENLKFANYPDQYGLNIVLADKWLELDAKWNHFVTNADDTPYIIHFVGRKPFYKAYRYSATYRNYFYKYLDGTAWRNAPPIGEYQRAIKKIQNILSKINQGRKK